MSDKKDQAQQQEPFGYFRYDLRLDAWVQNREGRPGTAFYTSPPASKPWVGLTDDERWDAAEHSEDNRFSYARAIEAKLREKNAQPSKPLPFNKDDMEGLDINQRLAFKLGWRSAEQAHGIKGDA